MRIIRPTPISLQPIRRRLRLILTSSTFHASRRVRSRRRRRQRRRAVTQPAYSRDEPNDQVIPGEAGDEEGGVGGRSRGRKRRCR